jgi:hypothetical protein
MGDRDMNGEWPRYQKRWTDLSLKELANFAEWMNRMLGYNPTVIGGWAVYFYNPDGLGSRDIDVLLPSWEVKNRVADLYLRNNGYTLREKAFGVAEWIKFLEPGNESSETYLDICTVQDRNIVHGTEMELPWAIANRHQRKMNVGGYDLYVPAPETLLLLKAKAAWDRAYDIRSGAGSDFLRDKVRKDRFDVLSLLANASVDLEWLHAMASEFRFTETLRNAVEMALGDDSVNGNPGIGNVQTAIRMGKEIVKAR